MGYRITLALLVLNALGLVAALMVVAAASTQAPEIAIQLTHALQPSIRMFVIGAGLPLVAWEIAESEFYRTSVKLKALEAWIILVLVLVSWALFFIAAWRLPTLIVEGLRAFPLRG
jgi:hypothetical protein